LSHQIDVLAVSVIGLLTAIGFVFLVRKHLWDVENIALRSVRVLFPLEARKKMSIWMDQQKWVPNHLSLAWGLIRDWGDKDAETFHRYLWSHHLLYAKAYERKNDFEPEHLRLTSKMLFQDLKEYMVQNGIDPSGDVKSVFDVGCSSGFMLRYMETSLFPSAAILEGNDIDETAIEKGKAYFREHGSKIRLIKADMTELDRIMDGSRYDLIFCARVLVYLKELAATNVIRSMLNHCSGLVVIYAIAHPRVDNSNLRHSETRNFDGVFFHNVDAMVKNAGGKTVYRRWEGSKTYNDQTVYFVFCKPQEKT
jgi:2-polyprenyl-3-methyl-5-hydroxy-6-metoxy-1,4-benzoquinol methylase